MPFAFKKHGANGELVEIADKPGMIEGFLNERLTRSLGFGLEQIGDACRAMPAIVNELTVFVGDLRASLVRIEQRLVHIERLMRIDPP
jgi:hypothetical protein